MRLRKFSSVAFTVNDLIDFNRNAKMCYKKEAGITQPLFWR